MPVRDEEIALVLILQLDPILERAVIVAEMQHAARPHAGKHPAILDGTRHTPGPITSLMTRPMVCMAGSNSQPSRPNTERPTTRNKPIGSNFSMRAPHCEGNKPVSTRPPSRGGIGSRLNKARKPLIHIPA